MAKQGTQKTETTTTDDVESVLVKIRKQYSGKDPDKATAAKLVNAWRAAAKKTADAEAALESLKAAEGETVKALAHAYGAKSLRVDGQVMDFACRGETVFFRRKAADIVDIG
jgi:hypothetical protein